MSSELKYLEPPTDEQWIEFWQKLRLFTFKRYAWLKVSLGVDLEDIVNEAVADVLNGTRVWSRRVEGPSSSLNIQEQLATSFFGFLCGVVQSKISHLIEKAKKQEGLFVGFDSHLTNNERYEALVSSAGQTRIEDRIEFSQLTKRMEELVSGDEAAVRIVRSLSVLPDLTPQEIAEKTDLNIHDIYNALKRIRRRLKNKELS